MFTHDLRIHISSDHSRAACLQGQNRQGASCRPCAASPRLCRLHCCLQSRSGQAIQCFGRMPSLHSFEERRQRARPARSLFVPTIARLRRPVGCAGPGPRSGPGSCQGLSRGSGAGAWHVRAADDSDVPGLSAPEGRRGGPARRRTLPCTSVALRDRRDGGGAARPNESRGWGNPGARVPCKRGGGSAAAS